MAQKQPLIKKYPAAFWLQVDGETFIRKSSVDEVEGFGDFIRLTTSCGNVFRIDGKAAAREALGQMGFNEKL